MRKLVKRTATTQRQRTQTQRVRRALLASLRDMEDTLGGWKAENLLTWLMPRIERTLERRP